MDIFFLDQEWKMHEPVDNAARNPNLGPAAVLGR